MSIHIFSNLPALPADVLFEVKGRYAKDQRPHKVDLGIGAYRDENGKPWVLPAVRAAEKRIHENPDYNHEYLGISGLPQLTTAAQNILFGKDSVALKEGRVASIQSLSGTGALHVAANLLKKTVPVATVYLSSPTWANHVSIFETQGLKTAKYAYWNNASKTLDIDGMIRDIRNAPVPSVFVLHACAHNPTGLDPNARQWEQILDTIATLGHIALFDSAYQGFASGNLDQDAYAVRLGVQKLSAHSPVLVCQSFAKNVGMYGERVGCFHVVIPKFGNVEDVDTTKKSLISQLNYITRSEVSNAPAYGAKIVSEVLNCPELSQQWHNDMITMSSRIKKMRTLLRDHLVARGTPGNWDHITNQCGMFSYTGLTPDMVNRLERDFAIYMVPSGRASIAGLNEGNVEYVASSIDSVVRHFSSPRL